MTAAEAQVVLELHAAGRDTAPPEVVNQARSLLAVVMDFDGVLAALEDEIGSAS